jgi:hypothetical protein
MTPDGWKQVNKPKKCLLGLFWKMKIKKEFPNG